MSTRTPSVEDRVLDLLREAGRPMSPSEIKVYMVGGSNMPIARVRDALDVLMADGRIATETLLQRNTGVPYTAYRIAPDQKGPR